jgi:hypothetical protein
MPARYDGGNAGDEGSVDLVAVALAVAVLSLLAATATATATCLDSV